MQFAIGVGEMSSLPDRLSNLETSSVERLWCILIECNIVPHCRLHQLYRFHMTLQTPNSRQQPDQVLVDIADYVANRSIQSEPAYETARYCLMDTLGCGLEALSYPECTRLLGPIIPGTIVPNGAKVPGTRFQLDPVQAAFNIGAMISWLDFNDTWLAASW